MPKSIFIFKLFLIFFLFFSCSTDNNIKKCTNNQIIINNKCIERNLLCGNIECNEHELCENNICKKNLVFSTYNLYDLKKENAYDNLAKFIKNSNIGIMVNQEIQKEDKKPLLEALKKLNIKANIKFSDYGGYGGSDGSDYLAVISRWPINSIATILNGYYQDPISKHYYKFNNMRPILKIKFNIFGNNVTVFDLHLKAQSPWPNCDTCIEKRRAQASALENYILKNLNPINDNIIVAGDANTAIPEEDFKKGGTLDMLCLKTDDIDQNDFLAINYEYKREQTHTKYDSILDHIILSPKLVKRYIQNSIDIITPKGSPSDHKALLLKLDFN